jgi:hypothetical protein
VEEKLIDLPPIKKTGFIDMVPSKDIIDEKPIVDLGLDDLL